MEDDQRRARPECQESATVHPDTVPHLGFKITRVISFRTLPEKSKPR